MVLITVDRTFCTASVGDKYEVVFGKNDAFFHAIYLAFDCRCDLLVVFEFKDHVGNFCVELEVNACFFQIFLHRKDQRFVLVVFGEFQGTEIRKSCNVMDETLEVELHLQGTVPVFECEHGSPVQPEGGVKYFVVENIFDGLIVEVFVLCHEEFHDLHAALLAEIEFAVCMSVFAAVYSCTAERVVRVMFVQPVIFVQNRNTRCFNGRNAAEQIPEAFEVVFHFTAASHDVAACRIKDTIAGTTGNVHGFEDVDMRTRHLCVTDKEAGCGKRCKTASDDVSVFVIYAFRFLRAGKCFVVTICIVDAFAVLFVFAAFCIAVVRSGSFGFLCFCSFDLFIFLRVFCEHCGCAGSCCKCDTKF